MSDELVSMPETIMRYYTNANYLLVQYFQVSPEGYLVKVFEQYLNREQAQHFAKRVMFQANTKLKAANQPSKVEPAGPLAPE